jgi:hypothetical protein
MAPLPTITITEVVQDNWQRTQRFRCKMVFGTGIYPVGGIPIDKALAAALFPTSNHGPRNITAQSLIGSGYIYDYIRSTGCLMILAVPPSGSLTSAHPLVQIDSDNLPVDQLLVTVEYDRNA